ncbi:uncharacterized protein [Onthophagus taurus]|uniref:uncharacterized protein isoform X1 n=2 Tax=Onthophagus taurus TaxID=166361 RepID=UPI0039BDD086
MSFKIVLLFGSISAIVISVFGEKCNREIALMENFDVTKMGGHWNVAFIGNEQKGKKKCMRGTNYAEVGKIIIDEVGLVDGIDENIVTTLTQIGSTSEFLTESNEYPPTPCWLISTDYTSYAVWFVCSNGHKQDGIIYMCTRDVNPSDEVLKKAQDALLKAGLMIGDGYLFKIDHSNC